MNSFWLRKKKYLTATLFFVIFAATMVYNIPSWALSSVIQKYSQGRLKFYDTEGTFWNGSGLLVALGTKQSSAPLLLMDWKIKLGLTKYIDIEFNVGNKRIAELYVNSQGANLDKLNVSLSITQVEQLYDIIKDMSVSGNLNVSADHILIAKKMSGQFKVNLDNISSGISRLNPLGSYVINLNAANGDIDVSTNHGAVLILNGSGSISGLTLNARINEENRADMLQFITLMGIPKPDGSYQLKIF